MVAQANLVVATPYENDRYENLLLKTGMGLLAGMGFTVSLFIANLAFSDSSALQAAKLSIVAASLLAGISGYLFLHITRSPTHDEASHNKSQGLEASP